MESHTGLGLLLVVLVASVKPKREKKKKKKSQLGRNPENQISGPGSESEPGPECRNYVIFLETTVLSAASHSASGKAVGKDTSIRV